MARLREQLKEMRERANLTLAELAPRVGYANHDGLQKVESGQTEKVSLETVDAIVEQCEHEIVVVPKGSHVEGLAVRAQRLDADNRERALRFMDLAAELQSMDDPPPFLRNIGDQMKGWSEWLASQRRSGKLPG